MRNVVSLREAGRLLALYLHLAEYLADKRQEGPIRPFLSDCFGSATMGEDADLEYAEEKLRLALGMLKQLSRDPALSRTKVLLESKPDTGSDSRPLIEDACELIQGLLDNGQAPEAIDSVYLARWYSQAISCFLQLATVPPPGVQAHAVDQWITTILKIACGSMRAETQLVPAGSNYLMEFSLNQTRSLIPVLRRLAKQEPNPNVLLLKVVENTIEHLESQFREIV